MTRWISLVVLLVVSACAGHDSSPAAPADPLFDEEESALRKGSGGVIGDFDYCRQTICASGEGDCDQSSECAPGSTCVTNVGLQFGMPAKWDYCLEAHCLNGVQDADETSLDCGGSCGVCACVGIAGDPAFCTTGCPCEAGEGDCDRNTQCAVGLTCGKDNGARFGFAPGIDACVASGCAGSTFPLGTHLGMVTRRICTYPDNRSCNLSCQDRPPVPIRFQLRESSTTHRYGLAIIESPYRTWDFGEARSVTRTATGLRLLFASESTWSDHPAVCPFTGWIEQIIPDYRASIDVDWETGSIRFTEVCEDLEGYCAHRGYQYGYANGEASAEVCP
jgi:hypothetical protein